jgi:cbb3-type cytochrome oxidase subunit 3
MIREAFTHPNPFAVIAMFAFIVLFVGVVVYLVTDRRRQHHDHMQNLPLEDEHHG